MMFHPHFHFVRSSFFLLPSLCCCCYWCFVHNAIFQPWVTLGSTQGVLVRNSIRSSKRKRGQGQYAGKGASSLRAKCCLSAPVAQDTLQPARTQALLCVALALKQKFRRKKSKFLKATNAVMLSLFKPVKRNVWFILFPPLFSLFHTCFVFVRSFCFCFFF